jgi:Vitamin-D-receptor interacting Mediator subunit 4
MATKEQTLDNEASMGSLLLRPLNEIQHLSQTLLLSLSGSQTAKRPPPPQVVAFLECDTAMAQALHLARRHQIKQRKIQALKNEILDLDSRWKEICAELESWKRELEVMINEGEKRIKAIGKAKDGVFHQSTSNLSISIHHFASSCYTLPRITCVCTESQCVHIRTTQYARPFSAWSTTTSIVLPAIPERREDAKRQAQCRSSPGFVRRNSLCWQR